jgi:hypothetical protein
LIHTHTQKKTDRSFDFDPTAKHSYVHTLSAPFSGDPQHGLVGLRIKARHGTHTPPPRTFLFSNPRRANRERQGNGGGDDERLIAEQQPGVAV